MPFTFSHPAIVLPFAKINNKYISLTGLVAGSIVPDFEYFLRLADHSSYSHTWSGLFWFDIPLGIIISYLFHLVARNLLIDNLPGIFSRRLQSFKSFDWNAYFRYHIIQVIISIVIGGASHIMWDGFTHAHGQFVEIFTVLNKHVMINGMRIPLFGFMWYVSSLVGAIIVLYALLKLPEDPGYIRERWKIKYWLLLLLISGSVLTLRLVLSAGTRNLDDIIVIVISAGLFGMLVLPFLYRNKR